MPNTWTTPSEMLSWLDKASPSEIYARAVNCDDKDTALTMCDHVLIKLDFKAPLAARTHFLKGRLFLAKDPQMSVSQFRSGLFDAKGVLPENDPEVVEAKRILQELSPTMLHDELVDLFVEKIFEYFDLIRKKVSDDEAESRLISSVSVGWINLWFVTCFNNSVQVEGLESYFSNKVGVVDDDEETAILEAFKAVDKGLHGVVQQAFGVFKANEHLYRPDWSELQEKRPFEQVENEYFALSEDLPRILASYITRNKGLFKPLPSV